MCVQTTKARIFSDSRWISGAFRFAAVIWNRYLALVTHFKEAATDWKRRANEQTRTLELMNKHVS